MPLLSVIQLNRLRMDRYLLTSQAYKLNLIVSSFCALRREEIICDLSHTQFDCS